MVLNGNYVDLRDRLLGFNALWFLEMAARFENG